MNNQNEQVEEEIPNIEQFQVSRSSLEEKDMEDDAATEDEGYTEDEVEFADGEGTQLAEEIPDEEEEDLDLDDSDDLEDDVDFEDDDLEDDDLKDDEV